MEMTVSIWWVCTAVLAVATIFCAAKIVKSGDGGYLDLSPVVALGVVMFGTIVIMAMWLIKGCVG